MKQIFAIESSTQLKNLQQTGNHLFNQLQTYQKLLEQDYSLTEPPRGVVWTTEELATTIFSDVPIPAYTNRDLIYMSPEKEKWTSIFLNQLEDRNLPEIRRYYETYTDLQMLEVLAHELTHHIDLFPDDFEDDNWESDIWFEEGMCFYLPRKLLLSEEEFHAITDVEETLEKEFRSTYGNHPLSEFGSESYSGNLTSIMYDYWRSYLAVKQLVDEADGDVFGVFERYEAHTNRKK